MSYNGSGTFNINTAGQPVVSGTVISSTAFNALTADLGTGLTTALTKDGQTTPTANIPMGTYKLTGLGAGTAAADAVRMSQLQSNSTTFLTATGTDTITATASPTLTAYAAGNLFTFVIASTNTGAVTLNIDNLGAKAITRDGTTALAAADLIATEVVVVVYDGTRFQVVNPNAFTNLRVSGTFGVTGVATFGTGAILGTPTSGTATNLTGLPLTTGVTGTLPVANGGTGAVTLSSNNVLLGNGSGALQEVAPSTSGNLLTSNGTTWTSATAAVASLTTASGSAPSYSARAWVYFNGTGTPVPIGSGNVSSITDNGTGDYTVNFQTAMPDVNYAWFGMAKNVDGAANYNYPSVGNRFTTVPATSSIRVGTAFQGASVPSDFDYVYVLIFR